MQKLSFRIVILTFFFSISFVGECLAWGTNKASFTSDTYKELPKDVNTIKWAYWKLKTFSPTVTNYELLVNPYSMNVVNLYQNSYSFFRRKHYLEHVKSSKSIKQIVTDSPGVEGLSNSCHCCSYIQLGGSIKPGDSLYNISSDSDNLGYEFHWNKNTLMPELYVYNDGIPYLYWTAFGNIFKSLTQIVNYNNTGTFPIGFKDYSSSFSMCLQSDNNLVISYLNQASYVLDHTIPGADDGTVEGYDVCVMGKGLYAGDNYVNYKDNDLTNDQIVKLAEESKGTLFYINNPDTDSDYPYYYFPWSTKTAEDPDSYGMTKEKDMWNLYLKPSGELHLSVLTSGKSINFTKESNPFYSDYYVCNNEMAGALGSASNMAESALAGLPQAIIRVGGFLHGDKNVRYWHYYNRQIKLGPNINYKPGSVLNNTKEFTQQETASFHSCNYVVNTSITPTLMSGNTYTKIFTDKQSIPQVPDSIADSIINDIINGNYNKLTDDSSDLTNTIEALFKVQEKTSDSQKEFSNIVANLYFGKGPYAEAQKYYEGTNMPDLDTDPITKNDKMIVQVNVNSNIQSCIEEFVNSDDALTDIFNNYGGYDDFSKKINTFATGNQDKCQVISAFIANNVPQILIFTLSAPPTDSGIYIRITEKDRLVLGKIPEKLNSKYIEQKSNKDIGEL